MSRLRLTQRMAMRNRKADAETPETPIDLGKNRKYHKIDEYHTFEPSLNHWTPDMRHEWKDNPREETGHGIPKNVKVYNAAKKATKLASLMLGKNASDEAILEQAKAFMRMGDRHLTASLNRYAECKECEVKTEEACTAAEEEKKEEVAPAPEATPEVAPAAEAPKTEEACTAEAECKECEVKTEEACTAAEEEKKEEPAPAPEATPEATPEAAPAAEEEEAVVDIEETPAENEIVFDEDATEADAEADNQLAAVLFTNEGEEETAPAETTVASNHKVGLKKLAGQPQLVRVASKNADELTGLWNNWENPEVR